jgi:hypothetical protein
MSAASCGEAPENGMRFPGMTVWGAAMKDRSVSAVQTIQAGRDRGGRIGMTGRACLESVAPMDRIGSDGRAGRRDEQQEHESHRGTSGPGCFR